MASKTFLLLALVFAFCLLITSEVFAEDLASNHDGEVDGRGGYNNKGGGHVGYIGGGQGGHCGGRYEVGGKVGGGGHISCRKGGKGGKGGGHISYSPVKGCRYGCCGGGGGGRGHISYSPVKGCKCCSSFEEATAYKQTQN